MDEKGIRMRGMMHVVSQKKSKSSDQSQVLQDEAFLLKKKKVAEAEEKIVVSHYCHLAQSLPVLIEKAIEGAGFVEKVFRVELELLLQLESQPVYQSQKNQ